MACYGQEGKSWGQNGGEFDRLATLLKAGVRAVKEDTVKTVMLHLAEGTKNDTFVWWFDEVAKREVPFDIIGLSFYTYSLEWPHQCPQGQHG